MPGGDEIVNGARARGRDEASEQALAAAFDKGGAERVTRLYWRDPKIRKLVSLLNSGPAKDARSTAQRVSMSSTLFNDWSRPCSLRPQ
jgi:hypothetical protein